MRIFLILFFVLSNSTWAMDSGNKEHKKITIIRKNKKINESELLSSETVKNLKSQIELLKLKISEQEKTIEEKNSKLRHQCKMVKQYEEILMVQKNLIDNNNQLNVISHQDNLLNNQINTINNLQYDIDYCLHYQQQLREEVRFLKENQLNFALKFSDFVLKEFRRNMTVFFDGNDVKFMLD